MDKSLFPHMGGAIPGKYVMLLHMIRDQRNPRAVWKSPEGRGSSRSFDSSIFTQADAMPRRKCIARWCFRGRTLNGVAVAGVSHAPAHASRDVRVFVPLYQAAPR